MVRVIALALLVTVLAAPAATAKRPATSAEKAAVTRAMNAWIRNPRSPAAKNNHVVSVIVSTVNPAYAVAHLQSKTVGPSRALLHHRATGWKVVDFGTGAFPCTDAPKKVLADLLGACS
jgi:anthranilate phosphoribosyltransferase